MLKMNSQIREFFRVDGSQDPHFQEVRFLHEEAKLSWEEIERVGLPRSWFELSRITPEDRVEFSRAFWLGRLTYNPIATERIESFFDQLDDIAIVLSRQTKEEPWKAELVYSLADNSSFFRGLSPADDEEIDWVKKRIGGDLPSDYWAFLQIHNGFGRLTEIGLLPVDELEETKVRLTNQIQSSDVPLRWKESWIDPASLFPFFEEYGVGSFQCFNAEWYPGSEMGNVYFSGIDYTLSDISDRKVWSEQLAYPTFLEWLTDFLEGMNSSL
jgi:hypothetical protein